MHYLNNGTQVEVRPDRKPIVGDGGHFSESGKEGLPSIPGADWFNDCIDEFQGALSSLGIDFDPDKTDHLKRAFETVSGKIDLDKSFNGVSKMVAFDLVKGAFCSTGGTKWFISDDDNGLKLDNDLYAFPISEIYFDDFDGDDAALDIREVIALIERLNTPIKVTGSGRVNLLKSSVTEQGVTAAFVIKRADIVQFDGTRLRFDIDINTPEMAGLDCVLAVAPENSSDASHLSWSRLKLSGGDWPLIDQRPKNVVKADFFTLRYIMMNDCEFSYSSEHNLQMSGFVVLGNKVRARFAGNAHNNFNFVVNDRAGDSAARTAYLLQNCSADYAGLHGYSFSGVSGHTYCHLDTCTADHIGRDSTNNTIEDTLLTSSAYNLENVRVFKATALGVEMSTKMVTGLNCRTVHIDGIYGVTLEHTDGATSIDEALDFDGFCENVHIEGFENRNSLSSFLNDLSIAVPAQYNTSSFTVDGSIRKSRINYKGGTDSSTPTALVKSPEDIYQSGMRRGAGEVLLTGEKLLGNTGSNWFNQSKYAAEQTYIASTGSSSITLPLLTLTNPSANAYIGFCVEAVIGSSTGSTPNAPVKFVGGAASASSDPTITAMSAVNSNSAISAPSLAWSEDTLELTIPETYAVAYIKVTAIGRPSTSTQTFEWEQSAARNVSKIAALTNK